MRNDFASSFILFLNNSKTNFDEPFSSFDGKNISEIRQLKKKRDKIRSTSKKSAYTLE